MATGIILHPLAQERLQELQTALQSQFGVDASHRDLVAAAVHGATPAQLVGMLIEFTKAKVAET
jgi:hypothetical protein